MLFGWFLRSKIDFILTKINVLSKGKIKKARLFKSFDFQKTYEFENSYENFKTYFEPNSFCNFDDKIKLFENRKNKTSWPLSPMDLMPYVQVMYYVKKYHKDYRNKKISGYKKYLLHFDY